MITYLMGLLLLAAVQTVLAEEDTSSTAADQEYDGDRAGRADDVMATPSVAPRARPEPDMDYGGGDSVDAEDDTKRVILGAEAVQAQIPFLAALFDRRFHLCGGSLISNLYVLTAAHCFYRGNMLLNSLSLMMGASNIVRPEPGHVRLESARLIPHEQHRIGSHFNDIGIIQLERAVQFNRFIGSVGLPSGREARHSYQQTRGTVCGWGRTYRAPKRAPHRSSPTLQFAALVGVGHLPCSRRWGQYSADRNLCIQGQNNEGVCFGDSGGPFYISRNNQPVILGLSSFVDDSCAADTPAAFTKVAAFLPWIQRNIGQGEDLHHGQEGGQQWGQQHVQQGGQWGQRHGQQGGQWGQQHGQQGGQWGQQHVRQGGQLGQQHAQQHGQQHGQWDQHRDQQVGRWGQLQGQWAQLAQWGQQWG